MTNTFLNQRILVLGLGDTGLSALRWLKAQGALLKVADTRLQAPHEAIVRTEMPEVQVHLGDLDDALFTDIDLIVISPGIALQTPQVQMAMQRGVPVWGDVELFARCRNPRSKVIAITGSNGKSTVTTLVGEMCKASGLTTIVAGNIGTPVLDTLQQPAPDVYVLELSSFQLETTSSLNADAATMLNLSEDHLDRHADMEAYALAKSAVFTGNGVQVLNRDDAYSMRMAMSHRTKVYFGLQLSHDLNDYSLVTHQGEWYIQRGKTKLLSLAEMHLQGLHNAANVMASFALGHAIGLADATMIQVAKTFKGLPHRVEWVAKHLDVDYFDDSKGTNVGATCAAIAGLQRKVVLIAGGDGKGQDFSPLAEPIGQHARAVVLIGRDAQQIEGVLLAAECSHATPIYHAHDLPEAVTISHKLAQAGDAVLLSPACASFDMFKNYVHRAQVFVDAVNALLAQPTEVR